MMISDKIKELYSLNINYSGFGISLRVLNKEDLPLIQKWRNSEDVRKFMDFDMNQNLLQLTFWYKSLKTLNNLLAFIILKNDLPVGFVEYKEFGSYESNSCVRGIFLDPQYHGQGIGTLVNFLQEQVLFELNVTKIVALVRIINSRNLHLWKKLGARVVKQDPDFYTLVSNKEDRINALDKIAVEKQMSNEWNVLKSKIFSTI